MISEIVLAATMTAAANNITDEVRTNRRVDPAIQAAKAAKLAACKKLGPTITDCEIVTAKDIPGQRAAFFIDDVIFVFQDLAKEKPKSIWDHFYLAAFKEAHEKYGLKVQMNIFYQGDFFYGVESAKFTLRDMPDCWKEEFQAAKDWLRFGFHSYSEFPDYPWLNSSYEDVKECWNLLAGEVERFAGPGMFAKAVVPHWGPMSKPGCRALKDLGVKFIWASGAERYEYNGDRSLLPYMHGQRIEERRQPETAMFWRPNSGEDISVSACAYNQITQEQFKEIFGKWKWVHDNDTGLNFAPTGGGVAPCLNLYDVKDIPPRMQQVMACDFIIFASHEEYWFPRYFAYQPDSKEKLMTACKVIADAKIPFVFLEDKIRE